MARVNNHFWRIYIVLTGESNNFLEVFLEISDFREGDIPELLRDLSLSLLYDKLNGRQQRFLRLDVLLVSGKNLFDKLKVLIKLTHSFVPQDFWLILYFQ